MKFIGVTVFSGLLLVAAAAPLHGDEVDDLFAGKPVMTQQAGSPVQSFESPTLDPAVLSPLEAAKLADEAAWDASIKPVPKRKSSAHSSKPLRQSRAPSEVSLVPEPSAIALGVGAILYFLIFFRRRHLP